MNTSFIEKIIPAFYSAVPVPTCTAAIFA